MFAHATLREDDEEGGADRLCSIAVGAGHWPWAHAADHFLATPLGQRAGDIVAHTSANGPLSDRLISPRENDVCR